MLYSTPCCTGPLSVCNDVNCASCPAQADKCVECLPGFDLFGNDCTAAYKCINVANCEMDGCEEHDHTRCREDWCKEGYRNDDGVCIEGMLEVFRSYILTARNLHWSKKYSLAQPFSRSLARSLAHSLAHSLTHSLHCASTRPTSHPFN